MAAAATVPVPQEIPKAELLPLDAPERAASYRSSGKIYRHVFRKLTAQDWEAFFAHIVAEFSHRGNGIEQIVDTDYAALVLYARAIQRVEGFRTTDGRKPEELPSWPECIPQNHRALAVDVLMKISRSQNDSDIIADGKVVTLEAMWNESEPGAMKQYRELRHVFALPTAEHRRRYLRARNRAFVAGGSRNGTTVLPSPHLVMVKLYDELIQNIGGYSIAGRELATREEIIREMDAMHKSAAVAELFPGALRPDGEEEMAAE